MTATGGGLQRLHSRVGLAMRWLHLQNRNHLQNRKSRLGCRRTPQCGVVAYVFILRCLTIAIQLCAIEGAAAQVPQGQPGRTNLRSPDSLIGGVSHQHQRASRGTPRARVSRSQTRLPDSQVRTAAVEIYDDFGDEQSQDEYQQILLPGATTFSPPNSVVDHYDSVGDCAACDPCQSCGALEFCHCQPFGWLLDWSRSDLWVGTCGFSGAGGFLGGGAGSAGQVAGSFGFQEGFNFGTRLPGVLGGQLGSQLGMRFTQSQLDGTTAGNDHRTQTFVTAGLFRRVDYGVQGGLVVDYLHDDWVYQADLLQLRGELSFLFSPCHDLGFRFTDSQQTDDVQALIRGSATPLAIRLAALNTYRFFYRARFGANAAGVGEINAGFTEDSAGILGASLRAPLQNQVGLDISTSYLLPPSDANVPYTQEGWNLSMALVWTPGRCYGSDRDYYRPLLDVASNGSLWSRHVIP